MARPPTQAARPVRAARPARTARPAPARSEVPELLAAPGLPEPPAQWPAAEYHLQIRPASPAAVAHRAARGRAAAPAQRAVQSPARPAVAEASRRNPVRKQPRLLPAQL